MRSLTGYLFSVASHGTEECAGGKSGNHRRKLIMLEIVS